MIMRASQKRNKNARKLYDINVKKYYTKEYFKVLRKRLYTPIDKWGYRKLTKLLTSRKYSRKQNTDVLETGHLESVNVCDDVDGMSVCSGSSGSSGYVSSEEGIYSRSFSRIRRFKTLREWDMLCEKERMSQCQCPCHVYGHQCCLHGMKINGIPVAGSNQRTVRVLFM